MREGDAAGNGAHRLPKGLPLPEVSWRSRHRAVLISLAALVATATVWSGVAVDPLALVAGAVPAAVAGVVAHRFGSSRRTLSGSLAVLGLLWSAATVVHLSDGAPEGHYLFFLVVAVATMYQAWAPFAVCAAFVAGYHLVLGGLYPEVLHDDANALAHPWLWGAMHAGLLAVAGVVGVAIWAADERVRLELGTLASRNELLMETLGDGLVAVGPRGHVVRANPIAQSLLGVAWEPLTGRDTRDLLPGVDAALLAFASPGLSEAPARRQRWTTDTLTAVPVEVTIVETPGHGDVGAVLTVRDLSSELRAEEAERRLATAVKLEATQRRDVAGLQAAMRPDALAAPGIEIGVIYEPAESSPAGGDLYDWFPLPDGSVQVTVVDVMGRGLGATRQALAVTATLRTLTLSGVPLASLVSQADAVLSRQDPELVATVVVVRYDPVTGDAEIVTGGHPPALHVHDGEGCYVETAGVPIGYPEAGSEQVARLRLTDGDLLLLYSDGVVEGTRDVGAGLDVLAKAAGDLAGHGPQEVAERLLEELPTVAHAEDDCLMLVLSRPCAPVVAAPVSLPETEQELSLPPELLSARLVRRHATAFAEAHHLDPQVTDALVLVLSELASNAIAHAETPFRVQLALSDGHVRGTVRDSSPRVPRMRPGRIDGTSGRGLLIVDRLARAWGVNAGPDDLGKTVWFTLSATPPPTPDT